MDSRQLLIDHDLSVTANRLQILDCLQDGTHFHAIVEISDHLPDLNVKSIYNTIRVLSEVGLIDSYTFSGVSKYALSDQVLGRFHVAHVVNEAQEVTHLSLAPSIFEAIKQEAKRSKLDVKAIKIFVEIK